MKCSWQDNEVERSRYSAIQDLIMTPRCVATSNRTISMDTTPEGHSNVTRRDGVSCISSTVTSASHHHSVAPPSEPRVDGDKDQEKPVGSSVPAAPFIKRHASLDSNLADSRYHVSQYLKSILCE